MINPWIYEIMKSEDLSQGFASKSKDFTPNCEWFHDELDDKLEIKRRDWPNTD